MSAPASAATSTLRPKKFFCHSAATRSGESGISRFPDVQLHIWARASARPRNDEILFCRLYGRCDQLDGIVAAPFRRSGNGGDLAALAIDQYRGRHPQRPAHGFKLLKNLGFWVAEKVEPGQMGILEKILRLFRVAGIDIDGDDLEIRAAQFGLQAVERRHLPTAGHAP